MKTFNNFVAEQILDELNKDTLYSYSKKSEADLNKKHKELDSQIRANKPVEANKTSAKLSNRDKGLDRAEARLNKEQADICASCLVDPCICDDSHGFAQKGVDEAYGKYRSAAWHADGGANDERHDLDKHYSKPAEHPHAVHINGKKWKTFGSQSHATNVAKKIPGATVHKEEYVAESADDHYAEAEAHLNKASKALETSDMVAHHFHMSNHHEAKGRWHEEKGRHSSADREYAKAEEHHEKSLKPDHSRTVKEESINELSSDTLQSYKEKAKKSADELTAKGKHGKSLDRTMFRMRATGKQIEKTTASIKKALNKEEALSESKHRVAVTVSEKDHPMVSKRLEKQQKRAIVSADNKDEAVSKAKKFYTKQGYHVHDAEYHSAC
jgi:hypothetical protein